MVDVMLKGVFFAALVLTELLPMTALADGYSDHVNDEIWSLRLEAQQYAAEQAGNQCGWHPATPIIFSDQIDPENRVTDEQLFRELMMMLRLDQNARAISSAMNNDQSSSRTRAVDARNLVALRKILDSRGFPSTEEVGNQGVNAALMLVAHADQDVDFQKGALRKMEDEVSKGRLSPAIPMVLKSIRPQVVGMKKSISSKAPDASTKVDLSPSECYSKRMVEITHTFISERFPEIERSSARGR
jgi:hypothetical protein